MECQLCHRDVPGLAKVFTYGEGIWVCDDCHREIDKNRFHPYSQVMEKVAMLETGYHINRKLARR
jgi:ribosomal protein L37AE/L43A